MPAIAGLLVSLMNTSLSLTRYLLSLNLAIIVSWTYCIHPYPDFKTANTIATSFVYSKLDYCKSLYYNVPQSQIKRLQNIQNSLARAVTRIPKSSHITPVLKSLHWLKINECTGIKYKLISVTYKVLTTNQPQYLQDLISVQPCHNTPSSSMVTLAHPPTRSSDNH